MFLRPTARFVKRAAEVWSLQWLKFWRRLPATGPDSWTSLRAGSTLSVIMCMATLVTPLAGFIHLEIMEAYEVTSEDAFRPLRWLASTLDFSGLVSAPLCQLFAPKTSLILGSLCVIGGLITSAFTLNILQMTLTMGVLIGIGMGITFNATELILTHHFSKYRTVAFGSVFTAGCLLPSAIFPPPYPRLNSFLDFNLGMIALGLLSSGMLLCTYLIDEPRWLNEREEVIPPSGVRKNERRSRPLLSVLVSILKSPGFILLFISNMTVRLAYSPLSTALDQHPMIEEGSSIFGAMNSHEIYAAAGMIGRISLPLLCDFLLKSRSSLSTICYSMSGVAFLMLPLAAGHLSLLLVFLHLVVFLGCLHAVIPCMVGDVVPFESVPMAIGVLTSFSAVLDSVKPTALAQIFESYSVCSAAMFLTASAWIALPFFDRWSKRTSEDRMSLIARSVSDQDIGPAMLGTGESQTSVRLGASKEM